jgi:hypothetical protein
MWMHLHILLDVFASDHYSGRVGRASRKVGLNYNAYVLSKATLSRPSRQLTLYALILLSLKLI